MNSPVARRRPGGLVASAIGLATLLSLGGGCGHHDHGPRPTDGGTADASLLADGAADAGACAPGQVATDAGCREDLGAPCTSEATCASGRCVDDVCCDTPCDAPCAACGADGHCGAAPDGPDDACATTCRDGTCQPCPADMAPVQTWCVDRYEAPNRAGALPLVMYTFVEAEAWCAARGRRLCFDDEWTRACGGPDGLAYPYGDTHVAGECNDEEIWRTYNQPLLNGWPPSVCTADVTDLQDLLDAARAVSGTAAAAADHVWSLYQGEPSGENTGCTFDDEGTFDLVGNVEEWTRRRDGGTTDFHGNLKGRYWAESRTCQSNVTVHGDYFRFYEIGFRCCADPWVAP